MRRCSHRHFSPQIFICHYLPFAFHFRASPSVTKREPPLTQLLTDYPQASTLNTFITNDLQNNFISVFIRQLAHIEQAASPEKSPQNCL
nr:MAG TPA: hypothetical protein [Caudoviricetes sp.]